eukprot:CAMPEP_0172818578 /NCGR_PEP_ID=MMETSP1075-20121228/14006_1 /TAXON_ID=2916 /ORGANISM="Ceratium fusus, Strain PA161109" /LENGTH=488 /DNA_ID=CAMNT_0013658953 /DNA_START=42 /DNA_END=1505 /DNA_ORIENTATION=-
MSPKRQSTADEMGSTETKRHRVVDTSEVAATMTTDEWRTLQVGMKELWPQPDYMRVPHPGNKGHTSYRDETFELVTRWMDETRISYRPHAKAPGSKSHVRYEEYSRATTVGEALVLGSWPADWCWDFERGYIKAEGPFRDEPLDPSLVPEGYELTDVDNAVMQWYRRELAKKYGLELKELTEGKGNESIIMRVHRLVATREARRILAECNNENRRVSDADFELVLSHWGFARNVTRQNVMQKDVKWVWSDTLGLLRDRTGDIHLTEATHGYPQVVEVLSRWLTDRLPPEARDFSWTSFNLNKNYAAKIHRDGNNFGPSMIAAFGDFTGGALKYFTFDDGKVDLDELEAKKDQAHELDLKNGLALFNGNTAHSVNDFQGTRFSVVFFTLGCHAKMKQADREKLQSMGVKPPKADEDPFKIISAPLGERASRRYSNVPTPLRTQLPPFRFWDKESLVAAPRQTQSGEAAHATSPATSPTVVKAVPPKFFK